MNRIAIWAANAGLFVLCCYLAAAIVNEIAAEALAPTGGPALARSADQPVQARGWENRQVILERDLFDVASLPGAAPAPVAPIEDQYEATKLPLELLGTAASSQASLSWAAVEDKKSRDHQVVRIGDLLLDRAKVVAIERRRIVIENQGRREELALEEEPGNGSVRRPTARAVRSPQTVRRVTRSSPQRTFQPPPDLSIAGRNPAEIFSSARILPKYEQGQMVGIQLSNVKPGSLFEEVGIQEGDVITQFNGIQIDSPQGSAEVLRELTEAPTFEITVTRGDGSERTLTYEVPPR